MLAAVWILCNISSRCSLWILLLSLDCLDMASVDKDESEGMMEDEMRCAEGDNGRRRTKHILVNSPTFKACTCR